MPNDGMIHCYGYCSTLSCLSPGAKPNASTQPRLKAGVQRTLAGVGFRVKAPVTRRPPHRSGREGFPHPVPREPPACAHGEPNRRHPVWRLTLLALALPCSGVSWIRCVSPASLLEVLPDKRDARRRLPSRGALGRWFPTFPTSSPGRPASGTMRRSDCPEPSAGAFASPWPPPRPWITLLSLSPCLAQGSGDRLALPCHTGRLSLDGRHSSACWSPRGPWALPRSRVTSLSACPALSPRWCPAHAPWRIQDCCLPATARRRLSRATVLRTLLWTTTIHIAGLHHAACSLVPASFVRP